MFRLVADEAPRYRRRSQMPGRVREAVVGETLEAPAVSRWALARRMTVRDRYFVSEASVYRILKSHDLITHPAD